MNDDFLCPLCNEWLSDDKLSRHYVRDQPGPTPCKLLPICRDCYIKRLEDTIIRLSDEITDLKDAVSDSFECPVCNEILPTHQLSDHYIYNRNLENSIPPEYWCKDCYINDLKGEVSLLKNQSKYANGYMDY